MGLRFPKPEQNREGEGGKAEEGLEEADIESFSKPAEDNANDEDAERGVGDVFPRNKRTNFNGRLFWELEDGMLVD